MLRLLLFISSLGAMVHVFALPATPLLGLLGVVFVICVAAIGIDTIDELRRAQRALTKYRQKYGDIYQTVRKPQ